MCNSLKFALTCGFTVVRLYLGLVLFAVLLIMLCSGLVFNATRIGF